MITINEPCNESWENMLITNNGKLCFLCSKEVIDFTAWSDIEILEYLAKNPLKVCGRLSQKQLIHLNALKNNTKVIHKSNWKTALALILSTSIINPQSVNATENNIVSSLVIEPNIPNNTTNEIESPKNQETAANNNDNEIFQGSVEASFWVVKGAIVEKETGIRQTKVDIEVKDHKGIIVKIDNEGNYFLNLTDVTAKKDSVTLLISGKNIQTQQVIIYRKKDGISNACVIKQNIEVVILKKD